jgi:hypothetical protein
LLNVVLKTIARSSPSAKVPVTLLPEVATMPMLVETLPQLHLRMPLLPPLPATPQPPLLEQLPAEMPTLEATLEVVTPEATLVARQAEKVAVDDSAEEDSLHETSSNKHESMSMELEP